MSLTSGSGGYYARQQQRGVIAISRRSALVTATSRLKPMTLALVAAGLAMLLGLVLWVVPGVWSPVLVLEVRGHDGRVLVARRVAQGSTVDYQYLHSVEQTTVLERFEVVSAGLRLSMTSFGSAGAGLPASHPDLEIRDGRFVIEGLDIVLRELPLLGSDATRSVLVFDGERFEVRGRATVYIRRRPAWTIWF